MIKLYNLTMPSIKEGTLTRLIEPGGKLFLTVFGGVQLGVGLTGAIKGLNDKPPTANGNDAAVAVLVPLIPLLTFLLLKAAVEGSDGGTVVVKAAVDGIADLMSGIVALHGL
jgi:hypothetical protein